MDPNTVRQDFPLLAVEEPRPVAYLDNACTTLKPRPVIDAVVDYYRNYPVCGGRSIHRLSNRVTQGVARSREKIAEHTRTAPEQVVFLKNTTEGINLVAQASRWQRGDVVLTSDKEHSSNFAPWIQLAKTRGVTHRVVRTREDGTFDWEAFEAELERAGERLRMASFVHVSNVDGVTFPVERIARRVHEAGGQVLVDAAQSAAHRSIHLGELGADFVVFSLPKMLGPSGVGILLGRPDALAALEPYELGGGTVARTFEGGFELLDVPDRFEAGLDNFGSLLAVEPALDYLERLGFEGIQANDRRLNERATAALSAIDGVRVLGPAARERTSIVPFVVQGLDAHDVAVHLDESADVAVRSGQHCVYPYFERRGLTGSVRASFHAYNLPDEVDRMVEAVEQLAVGLRHGTRSLAARRA